jgi:hypothetical protein
MPFENSRGGLQKYEPTGEADVMQKDAAGNTIGGAFTPSSSQDVTAAVASARIAIGTASYVRLRGKATGGFYRIAFGSATVVAVSTNDQLCAAVDREVIAIPSGATYMAYIRDTAEAADISVNVTLG